MIVVHRKKNSKKLQNIDGDHGTYVMHVIYLEVHQSETKAGRNASQGFYKEKPTEPSWQYAHLHEKPEGKNTDFFHDGEVDRMPINSVRSPLLNPHESKLKMIN